MSLSKGIQSAAAAALSAAMLIAVAACGTSDSADTASKSADSKDSSSTQGFDTSGIKKDDEIASLVDYTYAFEMKDEHDNMFLGFDYIVVAQLIALFKSLSYGITPDNPCPTGEVNRVVKGVILHPYTKR